MTIYVRNLDEMMGMYTTYAAIEQMPQNWQIPCMMLDAAQNENGMAQVNHVGHRMRFKGDTWYHMSKAWRRVYINWNSLGTDFKPMVSAEDGPGVDTKASSKITFVNKTRYNTHW